MSAVYRIVAAALSGLLLTLAMPPVGIWPLGWIALAPLLVACRGQRLIVGFLLSVVMSLVICYLSVGGYVFRDKSDTGEVSWIQLGCTIFGAVVGIVAATYGELKARLSRAFWQ